MANALASLNLKVVKYSLESCYEIIDKKHRNVDKIKFYDKPCVSLPGNLRPNLFWLYDLNPLNDVVLIIV